MNEPITLIIAGLVLVIVILIMIREYKVKNLKELGEKFDLKEKSDTQDKTLE